MFSNGFIAAFYCQAIYITWWRYISKFASGVKSTCLLFICTVYVRRLHSAFKVIVTPKFRVNAKIAKILRTKQDCQFSEFDIVWE